MDMQGRMKKEKQKMDLNEPHQNMILISYMSQMALAILHIALRQFVADEGRTIHDIAYSKSANIY